MSTEQEAQAAIQGLHDQPLNGRNMLVNVARPREESGGGYRSNNGGGGYRGGNNRY